MSVYSGKKGLLQKIISNFQIFVGDLLEQLVLTFVTNKILKKKNPILNIVSVLALVFSATQSFAQKSVSQKTSISFYSHTPIEDVKSNNYKSISTIDQSTGEIVFSVPIQSFEFEKELM